mmetsp:Transcript_42879/g.136270  ORF Transcript_42879/g.136270 Transcript_42879/m.136270 type:complete len:206 (+) Transcript_42879:875-1492(+)
MGPVAGAGIGWRAVAGDGCWSRHCVPCTAHAITPEATLALNVHNEAEIATEEAAIWVAAIVCARLDLSIDVKHPILRASAACFGDTRSRRWSWGGCRRRSIYRHRHRNVCRWGCRNVCRRGRWHRYRYVGWHRGRKRCWRRQGCLHGCCLWCAAACVAEARVARNLFCGANALWPCPDLTPPPLRAILDALAIGLGHAGILAGFQ